MMDEPAFAAKLLDKLSGQLSVWQDAAVQAEQTLSFAKCCLYLDRAYICQDMRISQQHAKPCSWPASSRFGRACQRKC
jgi:hypothetical protein